MLVLLLAVHGHSDAAPPHRYTVRVDPDLSTLQVKACFASPPPKQLRAYHRGAGYRLQQVILSPETGAIPPLETHDERIDLGPLVAGACVDYVVDISEMGNYSRRRGAPRSVGAILLSPNVWLWYPDPMPVANDIEVTFEHDPDLAVSAPWSLLAREEGRTVYRLGRRPYAWAARMALGRFPVREIRVAGSTLRVAVLNGIPPPKVDDIGCWVQETARAITTLYGRFPVPSPQVLVIPRGRGDEPVPWGQVMRGGGDAVHLYIDQRRPLPEFLADWTLAHEFSHLFLPRIDNTAPWLYEGVASYYQNVLRARAGLTTSSEAWQKLHAGFQRGIVGTPADRTLADVSASMGKSRMFMRVYWSGAAMALLADSELRRRTDGRQSLDTALAALATCCLPADREWGSHELMVKLDALTGTNVFAELYRQHVFSSAFPDLRATYANLGLVVGSGGLRLRDDAPEAALRHAIMRAPELSPEEAKSVPGARPSFSSQRRTRGDDGFCQTRR